MKKIINILCLSAMTICSGILLNACRDTDNDSDMPPGNHASLYLTDDPGFYDKVFVDIQAVSILVDTCSEHTGTTHDTCKVWEPLNVQAGVYDLLELRNGADAFLAGAAIPAGDISLIKIQLGPSDSLVKNGVGYPLKIATDSSIVLVNVEGHSWEEFEPGHFKLWLDFDVFRSIISLHNNEFELDPFIRSFTPNTTGCIRGEVFPAAAYPVVITVYNTTDTSYALPDPSGNFEVRGLDEGTYNVSINASNGYNDTTLTNISVTKATTNFIGDIGLHQ